MTIFGPDVSSYQRGVNISALPDPFVLLKVTEGTYYVDSTYPAFLAQAQAAGKVVVPYHFVTTEDPDLQAAFIAAHIGDKTLPLMLDVEPQTQTGSRPTVAMVAALIDRCRARGLRPVLTYLPRWYWQQLGSPPLAPLSARGQGLISSEYPGGSGYPGDSADGWNPYGGMTPLLYQFTDVAVEGGQAVGDRNAYRGTLAQFIAFLGTAAPTTTEGPFDMTGGTIPESIASQDTDLPDIAAKFPAGAAFDDQNALIWTDERAAAANEHARQARDAVAALSALTTADDTAAAAHLAQIAASIDALTAAVHTLGGAAGVPVDVQALAAALASALPAHLTLTVGAK